ncbi:MAG: NAD(P)-binding domain-containing protein, partial [Trebonia sp.]
MAADTVGFIGLGNMGIPMTRRLVGAGYQVRGFDTSEAALRTFTDLQSGSKAQKASIEALESANEPVGAGGGATASTELGSVGDGADAVILMLPDSDIVERVLLGRLAAEPSAGTT